MHWVDNFHAAYALDSFSYHREATGDQPFGEKLNTGYQFWKNSFFLANGIPGNYDDKTLPIDTQCSSQTVDSLVFFNHRDPGNPPIALNVAEWTIETCRTAPATSAIAGIRHGS